VDEFLQTARLRLRRFTTADADYLVALDGDPEVMRYLTNGKPTPREVVEREVLPSILRCYERSEAGRWAAEDLASGEFLGWLSLQPPKDGSTAELDLGYRLRRSAWGRGYAAEGARALIRKAFTDLGTQRVFAQTMSVNTRSRRVMESAGLRYLRTFHLQWDDPIPGTEHGEVEYELLREDWLQEAAPMSDARLVGSAWREDAFAVAFAEQESEAGEVVAQRLDAVGVAADEAGQGLVERAAVGREPVVQELQELAELHRIVQGEVHDRCPAAWRIAVVTSSRLRWSMPGMASRRLTGWPTARLAAMRTMRFSPPDAGSRPPSSAAMTATQSIHAIGVPSLMQAAVSTWQRKSSRWRKVPWLTIRPAAASSGWMPAAAARSAVLSWLVTRVLPWVAARVRR